MNPANTTVVVSSYKKPTDWTERLTGFDIRCYTKEDPTSHYNVDKNIGMEASTYLKYCIDSYDSLPEYTIFLHDEEFSWHHEGSIIDRIQESIGFTGDYKTLNNAHNLPEFYAEINLAVLQFYAHFLEPYLGDIRKYGEFLGPKRIGAAQMIISRSAILARPFQMYLDIYGWIMQMDGDDFLVKKEVAILMEYFWGLIFGDVKPMDFTVLRVAVICKGGCGQGQIEYCYQGMDFFCTEGEPHGHWKNISDCDNTKYDVFLHIDASIKGVNYDHFYSCLRDDFPYNDSNFAVTFDGYEDKILLCNKDACGVVPKRLMCDLPKRLMCDLFGLKNKVC